MSEQRRTIRTKFLATGLAVVVGCGVGGGMHAAARGREKTAQQETESAKEKNAQASTLGDQTDLNVTVYNSNIALVRDVRQLTLPTGLFNLKFEDIAATVNPATVHFRSLTEPDKLGVIEQNYEYDLLEPAKLLHKYVGKEVTLVRTYRENGETKHEDVKATLLADNNGPVWKIGNDIVTGGYNESYRFPEVPANLYEHPTLLMSLENSGGRKQQIEASYLAQSLLERGLHFDRGPRRQGRGPGRLGDAGEHQRHGVSQRAAATGGGGFEPTAGRLADGGYGLRVGNVGGQSGTAICAGEFQRISPVYAREAHVH